MQQHRARLSLAAAFAAIAWALPTFAQDGKQPPAPGDSCVDVRIGDARSYACLNRSLAAMVPERRFSAEQDAPFSAASPAPAVGTFNEAATRERLGDNFGKSAFPQRPPPPVFQSPLVRAR